MDVNIQNTINLPSWVIYAGIIGGFVVSFIEIIKFILQLLKNANLEVILTRDLFFRLTNLGEILFCNAVILSKQGDVEVRDINLSLVKKSGDSRKNYKLDIVQIGEKVARENETSAQHLFYTSSPITYITSEKLERPLYMAVLTEYSDQIRSNIELFVMDIQDFADNLRNQLTQIQDNQDLFIQAISNKIDQSISEYLPRIVSAVQLEAGTYELTACYTYIPMDGVFRMMQRKTKTAIVEFSVEDNIGAKYEHGMRRMLTDMAFGIIFPEKASNVSYPEYQPISIIEKKK